ncbi:MAG: chemotaxis protein CheB [Phycisphaerales bacterium]|nr:chemotaxis protein CheB [Phycisphaerales bacterium]
MGGVVLIGASTGAPRTHHLYLGSMPEGFSATLVVIQHMPRGPFIHGFMRYLHSRAPVPTHLARDGDVLRPAEVLVVEPGYHLRFRKDRRSVELSPAEGENYFAPSMDVTFTSAAQVFGRHVCVAMISGLHAEHDGLSGCQAVRRAGGKVLVTDPETTPCYHMVRQIREANAYDAEAPLFDILRICADWMRD